MSRWVAYSDDVTNLGTEPRGQIHYLNAETNEFPCGTETAYREWDDETADSAIERGEASWCRACHYAREFETSNPEQSA
jgi:hypothetical protein